MKSVKVIFWVGLWCFLPAQANVLKMGTAESIPYVNKGTGRGIELDIVRHALPDYTLDISYMTYMRAMMEVEKGNLDVMSPMSQVDHDTLFFSDVHVYYQPGIFYLKKNSFSITTVNDLSRYSIATFQGARGYFGEVFSRAVDQSTFYTEIGDLSKMIQLLKMERIETVIFDRSIFIHYWQEAGYSLDELVDGNFFPLFPAHVIFHHQKVRDDFNRGLRHLIQSGGYEKILGQYLSPQRVKGIMERHQQDSKTKAISQPDDK